MWICHWFVCEAALAAARIQSWRPNVLWRAQHLYDLGCWQEVNDNGRRNQSDCHCLIDWLIDWLIDGFDAMWLTNHLTLPDCCSWFVRDTTLERSYWAPSLLDWAVLRVWVLWPFNSCSMAVCSTCLRCHRCFCLLHNGNSFAVAPGEGRRAWTSHLKAISKCADLLPFKHPSKDCRKREHMW